MSLGIQNLQPSLPLSPNLSASWETRTPQIPITKRRPLRWLSQLASTPAGWSQPLWTGSSSSQFFLERSVPRIGFSRVGHRWSQMLAILSRIDIFYFCALCASIFHNKCYKTINVPYNCLTYQTSFHALPLTSISTTQNHPVLVQHPSFNYRSWTSWSLVPAAAALYPKYCPAGSIWRWMNTDDWTIWYQFADIEWRYVALNPYKSYVQELGKQKLSAPLCAKEVYTNPLHRIVTSTSSYTTTAPRSTREFPCTW